MRDAEQANSASKRKPRGNLTRRKSFDNRRPSPTPISAPNITPGPRTPRTASGLAPSMATPDRRGSSSGTTPVHSTPSTPVTPGGDGVASVASTPSKYALSQSDLSMNEDERTRLMKLVTAGQLTVDEALSALKGDSKDVWQAFNWQDRRDSFPLNLFRTHVWFCPSATLLSKFLEQYCVPPSPPSHHLPQSFSEWTPEAIKTIKRSVGMAVMCVLGRLSPMCICES